MRRIAVKTLAMALVLTGVSVCLGQQQAPPGKLLPPSEEKKKSKLEEMLAEALRNNPDIRVAVAKQAEADAELNRTRLQVTQKVIALHHAMLSQKAEVDYVQKQFERFKDLAAQKSIDSRLLDEKQQALTLAKAKLAELESQIPALLGKVDSTSVRFYPLVGRAAFSPDGKTLVTNGVRFTDTATGKHIFLDFDNDGRLDLLLVAAKVQGPLAERIRKALQTPVKVDYKDMTFDTILKELSKMFDGLAFRCVAQPNVKAQKLTLRFEEGLPLSAILQALADETGCLFFVREYGIVATEMNTEPRGGMKVEEFLRQHKAPVEKK